VKRVGKCIGFTVWLWPRIEVWFCPEDVKEHTHPGQLVEVLVLWGWGSFWRVSTLTGNLELVTVKPKTWFRWLTIPAGWAHGFHMESRWMVFVNRTSGRSPADNLVYPDGTARPGLGK